jgi:hypothetical protein
MAKQVQIRRDTRANVDDFTGASGEMTYITDEKRLALHDGTTLGGALMPNAPDLQKNSFTYGIAGGTANAITVSTGLVPAAYVAGMSVLVKLTATNTGPATLAWGGLAAKNIKKFSAGAKADVGAGDLVSGDVVEFRYDGTDFLPVQSGARSINLSEALIAPVAGDVHTILYLRDQETSHRSGGGGMYWGYSSDGYSVGNMTKESRGPCAAFVLRGGSIRISCQIKNNTSQGPAYVLIIKNNTIVFESGTSSTSYVDKSYDFSVSPGDQLCVQLKITQYGTPSIRYLKILSSTPAYGAVI